MEESSQGDVPRGQDGSRSPHAGRRGSENGDADAEPSSKSSKISVSPDVNDPENYGDNDDSMDDDSRASAHSSANRPDGAAEDFVEEVDRIDEAFHHDKRNKARAQREAFLYFLISSAYEGLDRAPPKSPLTVYFSVMFQLVSPFGLLGNLASIISICDHWRRDSPNHTISDRWWVLFLNSLALACGCMANVLLFLHAERWMRRFWGLVAVCCLYMTAVLLYMALLGSTQVVYFHPKHGRHYSRTAGYWHAVIAAALYFISSMALIANLIYFRRKKWNAALSHRQRRIMLLCSAYIAWIAIGGASFQPHSMIDISYADATYYCVVSTLTLGYGDIVPRKTLPRALAIPYIYAGLVLGGLATLSIFQASLSSARNESIATHVEQRRRVALAQPLKSEEEGFNKMRKILRRSRSKALLMRAVVTTSWLLVFWLIGALIFKYAEGWTYFEAFYYVAISLATTGYGDFTPSSVGGRAFFTYWALLAVPTMTTAVSDLSAVAMQWLKFVRMVQENSRVFGLARTYKFYRDKHIMNTAAQHSDPAPDTFEAHLNRLAESLPNQEQWRNISRVTSMPSKTTFSFDTWHEVMCKILGVKDLPKNFWISDMSPIRMSGCDERQFMLLASLNTLRLSMPETEDELKAKDDYDSTTTVTSSGEVRKS